MKAILLIGSSLAFLGSSQADEPHIIALHVPSSNAYIVQLAEGNLQAIRHSENVRFTAGVSFSATEPPTHITLSIGIPKSLYQRQPRIAQISINSRRSNSFQLRPLPGTSWSTPNQNVTILEAAIPLQVFNEMGESRTLIQIGSYNWRVPNKEQNLIKAMATSFHDQTRLNELVREYQLRSSK
jgi:hypothetical protein